MKRIPIFKKRKPVCVDFSFCSAQLIDPQPSLPLELWIEIAFYAHYFARRSFASLSRVSKALRACCISQLFTSIYMRPTRSKDMVEQLSESPFILDTVQTVYFWPAPSTWLPRFNKFPPLYDEFVGAMWRMPNLTELYVRGIGDLPASVVDFMIHNRALIRLNLSDVTIPPSAFHLQIPPLSYRSIQANRVTGDVEPLFSNSSGTLQRLEIGDQFPIQVISFLSHSPTNRMSSLVDLSIWRHLTEEQASWFVRLLPCCPVLGTLSIRGQFPSPMSAIPPQALPMLHSLRADEDGHALVLLDSPIRRIYTLDLTLKGPLVFRFLGGVHSQPTFIYGEIAYACLATPDDGFHRLVQNCKTFGPVVVPSNDPVTEVRGNCPENCSRLPFTEQITPTARLLTLMPSLEDISIIFRLPAGFNEYFIAGSLQKPRAMQVIQHWLKQADQYCPCLQHLSIKIDITGCYPPYFVFDCARRQQNPSKKWVVQIWRDGEVESAVRKVIWIANLEIET